MTRKKMWGRLIFWPTIILSIILLITSSLFIKDDFVVQNTRGIVSVTFALIAIGLLLIDDIYVNVTERTSNRAFRFAEYLFFIGLGFALASFGVIINELQAHDFDTLWTVDVISLSILGGIALVGIVLFLFKVVVPEHKK